jgi:hypothetical protein
MTDAHAAPGVEKWVWKLFTGEAYPYIRRTLQHQKGAAPTADEMREKFLEVYSHSVVKIMVMELVGLGLEFQELASHAYGTPDFAGLMADPIGYLGQAHGGGKFKLSFYVGEQFVATQNFKVPGRPGWNMRKCLTSIVEAMEQKDRDHPEPASFEQRLERLCVSYGLRVDAVRSEKSALLTWIKLTAGTQYEDYIAQLLACPDPRPVMDWLFGELITCYKHRQPA